MRCKFCKCTENRPCLIPHVMNERGDVRVTFGTIAIVGADEEIKLIPCGWLIPGVCTSPGCVEKAYVEAWPLAEELAA